MNSVLIVIDMQSGLLNRDVYKKQELIDNINFSIDYFNAHNMPIIFTRHNNQSFLKLNSEDWQVDSRVKQNGTDIILEKTHSSIFKEKMFTAFLKDKNITRIYVCGLVSNGCVQAACTDGVKFGFEVYLVDGAHSTWSDNAEKVVAEWTSKLKDIKVNIIPLNNIANSF